MSNRQHPSGLEYRLQPIMRLHDDNAIAFELLAGRDRCPPMSLEDWIEWYSWLPLIAVTHPGKRLFVNVDSSHLLQPAVMTSLLDLHRCLEQRDRSGSVVLEWTEHGTEQQIEAARGPILELQAKGFPIAVDDVGSGADGIGRICHVRAQYAKISHPLFHSLRGAGNVERLWRLRMSLESFGSQVVLEGVETLEDLQMARAAAFHLVQGFFFPATNHAVELAMRGGGAAHSCQDRAAPPRRQEARSREGV